MKISRKNFLLIEHGGARKEFTLKTLKQKGLNVYLATTNVPDWAKKHIPPKNILITDTYNTVQLLSDVVSFIEARKIKLDAVGTFFEHTVTQTADLASALGL